MGYFEGNEYIITDMRPIRPLKNYLWSEKVVSFTDQLGRGSALACIDTNRRTFVKSKRYFYLKDLETGKFFSPNRNFYDTPFEVYECHVGLGYQTIISEYDGLLTEMTITVPENDYVELVRVRLFNKSGRSRRLDGYYYCDIEANITEHWAYGKGYFDDDFGGIIYEHDHFKKIDDYNLMFAKCNFPLKGFSVNDEGFFGTYGDEKDPVGLMREQLSSEGTVFEGFYCAAMQFDLDLAAGETKEFIFICGIERNKTEAKNVADKYLKNKRFDLEIETVKHRNDEYNKVFVCETPDKYFDILTNIWTKRQLSLGKTWGRVYGKGFRDVMQDISAFVSLDPALAKKQILHALSHQYESGNAIRMYEPDFKYPYYDMPVWIPETVTQYIKETGDFEILWISVPYLDSELSENVFCHVKRGLDFLLTNRGVHNLVLWGGGDWNDSMNNAGMKGKGESVWLSIATVKAVNEFLELLGEIGKEELLIGEYEKKNRELKAAIEKYGWDGDHYIYGYADSGEKVGADENAEGKIYLNPQTWAILAGIRTAELGNELMDTVEKRLQCKFGYVQNTPPYTKGIEELGRSTYFIPGLIENGSVYNHGVAFKLVADCLLNRADMAYKTYLKIRYDNPENPDNGVEPYAFSNMYIGPDSPYKKGFAPMCWITGTAGWMYRAFTEYMLGIQADYNGLRIRPNVPSCWDNVKIKRKFRGAIYLIEIRRSGLQKMIVNGVKNDGEILPIISKGKVCNCVIHI